MKGLNIILLLTIYLVGGIYEVFSISNSEKILYITLKNEYINIKNNKKCITSSSILNFLHLIFANGLGIVIIM